MPKSKLVVVFVGITLLVNFNNCGPAMLLPETASNDSSTNYTFNQAAEQKVLSIFQARCVLCHGAGMNTAIYSFNNILNVQHLINIKAVVPGNANASPIYADVISDAMPLGGPALSAADKDAIRDWILSWGPQGSPSPSPAPTATASPSPSPSFSPSPTAAASPSPTASPSPSPTMSPSPSPSASPMNANATFTWISVNILQPKCVTCHKASGAASANLRLNNYTNTLAAVVPNSPATSKIYIQSADGSMPKDAPDLSTTEIQAIYDWIAAGALNN